MTRITVGGATAKFSYGASFYVPLWTVIRKPFATSAAVSSMCLYVELNQKIWLYISYIIMSFIDQTYASQS